MITFLLELVKSIPSWLAVFLISGLPTTEIRLALPLAIEVFNLSWPAALFWTILGNLLPVFVFLILLETLHKFLINRLPATGKYFDWLFERSRVKFIKKYEKYGAAALILFVGIPLPFTGAWTGAVAAFVFGIPFRHAFLYITLGVLLAAAIISSLLLGLF